MLIKSTSGVLKEEKIYSYSPKTILTKKYGITGDLETTTFQELEIEHGKSKSITKHYENGGISTVDSAIFKHKMNRKGQLLEEKPLEYNFKNHFEYPKTEYSYYKNGLVKSFNEFVNNNLLTLSFTYEYEYY